MMVPKYHNMCRLASDAFESRMVTFNVRRDGRSASRDTPQLYVACPDASTNPNFRANVVRYFQKTTSMFLTGVSSGKPGWSQGASAWCWWAHRRRIFISGAL